MRVYRRVLQLGGGGRAFRFRVRRFRVHHYRVVLVATNHCFALIHVTWESHLLPAFQYSKSVGVPQ